MVGLRKMIGDAVWRYVAAPLRKVRFGRSADYWEQRYADGGTSGAGSYGVLAEFKARWLNQFIGSKGLTSVVELGCGDGNQLSLLDAPAYTGLDISTSVIERCRVRFENDKAKRFETYIPKNFDAADLRCELALSLDVIFHLVEDAVFDRYMRDLFSLASHFVVIYSDDTDENTAWRGAHIRRRRFSTWIAANMPDWQQVERVVNEHPFSGDHRIGSRCDFFVYAQRGT